MKKLRNVLAAALVLLPVLASHSGTRPTAVPPESLNATLSPTGYCWVFHDGRWWQVSC
jgi:hypothetical protein